jgi:TRAP-type C4-dicarboxylate transport system substrate-binding protein
MTHMPLAEWLSLDEYYQEAVYQAVSKVVEAQKKENQEQTDKIMKEISDTKETGPYISPFAGTPKPKFSMD